MKLTTKQLKSLIKEEANKFLKSKIGSLSESASWKLPMLNESPWIGSDETITDTCPMCLGNDEEHTSSGCDYKQCGFCNFDHSYEPEEARQFHQENDPEGLQYK